MQRYFFPLKAKVILVTGLCFVCSGCSTETVDIPTTATGALMIVPSGLVQKVSDAATLIKNSFHTLVEDAKDRSENITEGAQKIREGKEQIEKGVRGE